MATSAVAGADALVKDMAKTGLAPTRVAIIYYSMYGHVGKLAAAVKAGVEEVPGVEAFLFQVPELLPEEVLGKMHAPPKDSSVPVMDSHTLTDYDGFVFGFPTRFGSMASQMKAFFDSTGGIWMKGGLIGKPAGLFTSTAGQNGGQETTIMTAVTQLTHHGMIFVPTGYAAGSGMYDVQVAHGGSPWGAGTLAGADGSRQPSEIELLIAKTQGKQLATVALKLKA